MNRSFIRAAAFAAASFAFVQTAAAHDHMQDQSSASATISLGQLAISGAFARATLPGAPVAGGYLTIANHGQTDDTLVGARSPAAGDLQLHTMRVVDDVMQMYEMEDGIPLPAGETVSLKPGGLHIMFMQLSQPFVAGESVAVTLTFAVAGEVTVSLDVRGAGAMGADHGSGGH